MGVPMVVGLAVAITQRHHLARLVVMDVVLLAQITQRRHLARLVAMDAELLAVITQPVHAPDVLRNAATIVMQNAKMIATINA